ncbi:MAG: hypothetical protein B7Y51_07730 [Burkholderiales bacterium 28-67-8]|nr:MAG: hypothetical protein B7Y51_07730 [Burkholderiales bacterium 28-67-8]
MTNSPTRNPAQIAAVESRLGLRLAARLSEGTERLPHDVTERLRFARGVALSRMPKAAQSPGYVYGSSAGGATSIMLGSRGAGGPGWWRPAASLLQVLALAGGLFLIGHLHAQAQISAAAEIDTALLSDDLPPEAYNDPGFVEFLKTSSD